MYIWKLRPNKKFLNADSKFNNITDKIIGGLILQMKSPRRMNILWKSESNSMLWNILYKPTEKNSHSCFWKATYLLKQNTYISMVQTVFSDTHITVSKNNEMITNTIQDYYNLETVYANFFE